VALVRIDVLGERIAAIIRVKIISELGTTLAVTSNCNMLQRINRYKGEEAIEWDVLHDGWEIVLSFPSIIKYIPFDCVLSHGD
jgi:hypothetical protein